MRTPDGEVYGPVERGELDTWFRDGRLDSDCQLLREGRETWQSAAEVYPQLQPEPVVEAVREIPPAPPSPTSATRSLDSASTPVAVSGTSDVPLPDLFTTPRSVSPPVTRSVMVKPAERGWIAVDAGLGVSNFSLWASMGCVVVLVISWTGLISPGSQPTPARPGDSSTIAVFSALLFLSTAGLSAATVSLVTGWCVCLKAPKQSEANSLIIAAVGCAGACLALALLISIAPAGLAGALLTAETLARLTFYGSILICLLAVAAMALFGLFLGKVGTSFGDMGLTRQGNWFALAQIGALVWYAVATFVVTGEGVAVFITKVAVSALVLLGSYYWLGYLVRRARRPLTLVQPAFEAQGAESVQ
jgi:hypothetical protein